MFSADPRCVLEQGTFYQNRMIPSVALFTFYSNSCCHVARPGARLLILNCSHFMPTHQPILENEVVSHYFCPESCR